MKLNHAKSSTALQQNAKASLAFALMSKVMALEKPADEVEGGPPDPD